MRTNCARPTGERSDVCDGVGGRDHVVLGAPHDERRDRGCVLEVVVCADALAAEVDDGAGGREECRPARA